MKSIFIVLINLLFLSTAVAETMVLTKFEPGSRAYNLGRHFFDQVNLSSNSKYVLHYVPGANGENALERALSLSDRDVIVYGGVSNFIYSEINQHNAERYRNNFRQLKSLSKTYASVFVHKNDESKTIQDLVGKLQTKKNIFHGMTERANLPFLLNAFFLNQSKLPQAKTLRYKTFGELAKALEQKEVDYGLMAMETNSDFIPLMKSVNDKNDPLSGIVLGYKDFVSELRLILSVPINNVKYDQHLTDVSQVCTIHKTSIENFNKKLGYQHDCVASEKELDEQIRQDIVRYKKYISIIGK